jgi:hypothetical protein
MTPVSFSVSDGWTQTGLTLSRVVPTSAAIGTVRMARGYDTCTTTGTATSYWGTNAATDTATTVSFNASELFYFNGTNNLTGNCDGTWTETYPCGEITWEVPSWEVSNNWTAPNPLDRLANIIRNRHAPAIHTNRKSLNIMKDVREMRARETLKVILGEEKYRRFVKAGFVSVTNPISQMTYQIFHSTHHLTHVYKNGQMIDRLCIYMKGNFPPTDFVITMYLMALNNDQEIWKIANKHGPARANIVSSKNCDLRSLPEILKELKAA